MIINLKAACLTVVGVLATSVGTQTLADNFPEREIVIVVPFAPGGSTDFVARTVGSFVERELGTPVIIENLPGANTIVGTEHVANADPNGYTLVLATNGHTTNSSMYRSLPYDAEADFSPVVLIGMTPNVIAVGSAVGATTLEEMLDAARESGQKVPFATAGHGTIQHFTGELLGLSAEISVEHIAYQGGGPAATDVMAGHVPMLVSGLPPAMGHIQSGSLIPLAVTSAERSPALPDVPTVIEAGYDEVVSSFYLAVLAPAGTPENIIGILNSAFNKAVSDEETAKRLTEAGVVIEGGTPEELKEFLQRDTAQWTEVIEKSGIEMIN